MSNLYNTDFYDLIRPGVISSVDVVVPVIYDLIKPSSVIDIGSGEGYWAHKFKEYGCFAIGVDGEYVTTSPLGENFIAKDISKPFTLPFTADLVICLEVAEHLPESRAVGFVADLCKLGPTILFSAAIPRQSGVNHIHLKFPSYWKELFAVHGYEVSGSIRDQFWDDDRIEVWYRSNILLITKEPEKYPGYFPDTTKLDRIHPVMEAWWS